MSEIKPQEAITTMDDFVRNWGNDSQRDAWDALRKMALLGTTATGVVIERRLLQKALDRWGTGAQARMMFEECGELIAALAQYERGRGEMSDVVPEIADVLIMAHQMRLMFGAEDVDRAVEAKMKRLADMLKGSA